MKRFVAFLLLLFISQNSFADNMTCGATRYNALYERNTYNCGSGYYLPADTDGCVACLYGHTCSGGIYEFNETTDQGIVTNTYTCTSGQYLPANTLGCVACPAGATCVGGTYDFNENNFSGLSFDGVTGTMNNACANNFPTRQTAIYEINTYNCAAGEYLPAGNDWITDTDGCTTCPENSYCPGGTYTFNETTPQGITACGAGLYSPAGARESAQCGHIMHVGDDVVYLRATKKTSPSVHVKIGNDIFYGNMTTNDVPMNSGTIHKLKLNYHGTTYSVYDDTVVVNE